MKCSLQIVCVCVFVFVVHMERAVDYTRECDGIKRNKTSQFFLLCMKILLFLVVVDMAHAVQIPYLCAIKRMCL